ncbi:Homeodomain-like protein [Cynara cardunculus var. scolymus]|uniref:Homeodomain-like protein n=1 Tax=Cynara cardunculus var. scolymus TaxID=59895 RepID=A0A118JV86_CYNCS|nr:Homeodomain-like protein [Cynara cardunculus var. scolymus]
MTEMMSWRMQEEGWRKGPWTPGEDKLLAEYVAMHGEGRWSSVASCSEEIDRGLFTESSQTTLQETNQMIINDQQQQQNPSVMAQDVARWWDTVSEDGLWSRFLWNNLDSDHPNQAVMEQPFQMLDSLSMN